MHNERFYTLSASCPDRVGIIARVSGFIAEHQGWILESSYHADPGEGCGSRYFMRIEVKADSLPFPWRVQTETRPHRRRTADGLDALGLRG